MNTARAALFSTLLAASAACTTILGLEKPSPYDPYDGAIANPYPPPPRDGSAEATGCSANLENDPQNCGRCARACGQGASCSRGRCGGSLVLGDLPITPQRLLIDNDVGVFLSASQYGYVGAPINRYCYNRRAYAFSVSLGGSPRFVADICSSQPNVQEAAIGRKRLYTWVAPSSYYGDIRGYDLNSTNDGGAPSITLATNLPPQLLRWDSESSSLLFAASGGTYANALREWNADDGGVTLALLLSPNAYETFRSVDRVGKTTAVEMSGTVVQYPAGCKDASCRVTLAAASSVCGVRVDGDVIRWCGLQSNAQFESALVLLYEVHLDGTGLRITNAAPMAAKDGAGNPVAPLSLQIPGGVLVARGSTVDFLPLEGPVRPLAQARARVVAVAATSARVYFAEPDAIQWAPL